MIPVTQFMTSSKISTASPGNRPMFTDFTKIDGVLHPSRYVDNDYRVFWRRFRDSPELIGTVGIPITDILGDRPTFTKPDGSALGKTELRKAKKFYRDNRGKETLRAFLFDAFVTGDGYLWKGSPNKKELMSAIKEVCKKMKLSSLQTKELSTKAAQDEDLKKPKMFDYVASETMDVLHNEFEIKGYVQNVNGNLAKFKPEDIIHYRYYTMQGRVQGFSPIQALSAEIFLLTFIKRNMLAYMENGGTPDKVFILPKEIAKSKNHQFLLEQLRQYKRVQNRHGSMVFTGDLEIQDLQGSPKDLEYKDLALYVTSNIAFAFGIPVSRIPYLIGSSATKGDSGGLAESGYWNRISDMQDSIEDLLNGQLFESMGWNIHLNRKYKQDEVREAQTANMVADTLTKYQEIVSKLKMQPTLKKTLEILGWNEEDVEECDFEEDLNTYNSMNNQNRLSDDEVNKESDNRNRANTKRNVANQKGTKAAVTQP